MRCLIVLVLTLTLVSLNDAASKLDFSEILENIRGRKNLTANIDGIIDENIEAIRTTLKDPAELKDKKLGLTRHIFFRLTEGSTQKVSQLYRTGACTLSYENKVLEFEGNFGWESLDFSYDYFLQVLFYKKQGKFLGSLNQVRVKIVLDVDFKDHRIILRNFKFVDAGRVSLRVEGQKLSDKIFNLVLKFYTWVGKWSVLGKVQSNAVESIEDGIDELNEILGRQNAQKFTFENQVAPIADTNNFNLFAL